MSVVGIDLGTTNTVVACVRSGKVHVLADERGQRLLPSVVSFHPNGEVLVGGAAKARRVIDPKNTVYSHKRLIGRSWGSPEITQARERFAFDLREGPGQGPLVHARGQDYTLPEISAFVLRRARQIAEAASGEVASRAVITVPAHFNELQRASTKVAGRVSGVEVLRILNEPTAAALAYGLGRSGSERVAVYDFGGGTFDCTLLDLNGNVFEVLATAGDSFLGGDDVDGLIAERMAEVYLKTYRSDPRTDAQMLERLKTSAEDIKIALSTKDSHTVTLKDFGHAAGGASIAFSFSLSRSELEHMMTPLVERTFKVTQDALALARLSPTSFDKVILVGGSTRAPLVRKRVEAFFGQAPLDRVNPDEVVAIGAAIQAAALTEGARRKSIPAPPPVIGKARTLPGVQDANDDTQTGVHGKETAPPAPGPAFGSSPPAFGFDPPSRPPATMAGPPSARGGAAKTIPQSARAPVPSLRDATLADPSRRDDAAFGGIEEPPSLYSTPSASVPSFPSMTGPGGSTMPSPISDHDLSRPGSAPDGPFGALPDLSLVSSTGTLAPHTAQLTTGRPSEPSAFGHVSDLSLVSSTAGATANGGDELEEARRQLLDELNEPGFDDTTAATGKGGTLNVTPEANPAAARGTTGGTFNMTPARAPAPLAPPHDDGADLPAVVEADLPAIVGPRGAPARQPEPRKMSGPALAPGGSSQMVGRPPQPMAPQPFGPMERESGPPSRTKAMPAPTQKPFAQTMPQAAARPAAPTSPIGPAPNERPRTAPMPQQPPPLGRTSPLEPPNVAPGPRAPAHHPSDPPFGGGPFGDPRPPAGGSQPPMFGDPRPPAGGSQPPMFGDPRPPAGGSQPPMFGAYASAPPPAGAPLELAASPRGVEAPYPGPSRPPPAQGLSFAAPLLVDVTPRGLVVETAGGFTDTIIPRNAKIPCERTRRFATGRDMQTSVRVRVAQGEGPGFAQNTYLGEVELSGLRPAPRGDVVVAVTFEVDADGTLRVRARDVHTGQEARATLQLVGVADESSVVMMINRFAQQPTTG